MTCIAPRHDLRHVALRDLAESHGLTPRNARMFERYYELESVLRTDRCHRDMLTDILRQAADRLVDQGTSSRPGTLVYCKTQTHNTFPGDSWLQEIAADAGLTGWDCFTLSMTNCASLLAAAHFVETSRAAGPQDRTVILIAGEKAFHPAFSKLSVGLLSERPVSVILSRTTGDWHIRRSFVSHLPRYHINPQDMPPEDKRDFGDAFYAGFEAFLSGALKADPEFARSGFAVLPYNLNKPLLNRLARALGWCEAMRFGDVGRDGHMFCSDIAANLSDLAPTGAPAPERILAFAAGMGVSYGALFLERLPLPH